jgi:hypothetical protein
VIDKEELLERWLEGVATQQTSLSTCADRHQSDHPEVMADLRLAQRLQQVRPPEREVADARARVRLTVLTAIAADLPASPVPSGYDPMPSRDSADSSDVESPNPRSHDPRFRVPRPPAFVAAALILVAVLGGWIATSTAANALPGTPLYGLKRAEEGLDLATAWSDQRRGDVLLTMADQRLAEIRAEARGDDVAEVHALAADFEGTMHDLIQLTASMQTHHDDTRRVAAGLARTLAAENQVIRAAHQSGQVFVAQTLTIAVQDQLAAIQVSNVRLPPVAGERHGTGTTSGGHATGNSAGPTPPAAPAPAPAVAPRVPPAGGARASGGGNGGSGSKDGLGGSSGPGEHASRVASSSIDTTCGTTPCGTTPCGTTPCGTTPCGATPCGTTPCGTTPCGATPCGTTPCGTTPCATGQSSVTRPANRRLIAY